MKIDPIGDWQRKMAENPLKAQILEIRVSWDGQFYQAILVEQARPEQEIEQPRVYHGHGRSAARAVRDLMDILIMNETEPAPWHYKQP